MRTIDLAQLSEFSLIMERYYQTLFRFAAQLCGNPARAMILTQQTLRQAFERHREFPLPTNVRTWLFTLLLHRFLELQTHRHFA